MKAAATHVLAVTTKTVTHKQDPTLAKGEKRVEPLFHFPVQVVKATEDAEPKFENAAPSGGEYAVMYRDEVTGEFFEYADRKRGVRIGGEFHEIPAEAIDQIEEQTKLPTMIVTGKAPLAQVLARYGDRVTSTHFLQSPKDGVPKAYKLLYEGLKGVPGEGRPAMALTSKRTARTRQKLVFIYADEQAGCLKMCEATFAAAVREPDALILAPQQAQIAEAQVNMVREVVDNLPDGISVFENETDEAIPLREALIEQALAGEALPPIPVAETAAMTDLEGMLAASLK